MNRPHLRTAEGLERRRIRDRARRKKEREDRGAKTRQEWLDFVRAQRAKKVRLAPVQPSREPGQTVESFVAQGGEIDVLPGFQFKPHSAGMPVRAPITGNRGL